MLSTLLRALVVVGALAGRAPPAASAGVFDDISLDGDGRLILQEPALARAVVVQSDGRIVLAGSDAKSNDFAVWRVHPDGSLDRSFDGDGRAIVDAGGHEYGNAVALAPGGKIVVAGQVRTGRATDDFAVVRLEGDGDLDQTFTPGGPKPGVKVLGGDAYDVAEAVLVQGDGKIVVSGSGGGGYAIARLEPNGDVDGTTFELDRQGGLGGTLGALTLDRAGRIVAGGSVGVARFLDSGALDDTFAGDGTAAAPRDANHVTDVLVEPDGAIVIAGDAGGTDQKMFLARIGADGETDTAFGINGMAAPEFDGSELAAAVERQADGRLLLVGASQEAGVAMAVARYDARGVLDAGYGAGGRLLLPFGSPSVAADAVLQADGRLVVAGVLDAGNNDPRPAVARLLPEPPQPGGGAGGGGAGGGGGGPAADTQAPVVGALKVTRKAAGKRARIAFSLSEPARLKLALKRRGRRAQRFALDAVAGANRVRTPRRLKRGRYRLTVVAVDAAGNASAPARARFRMRTAR
jgi:uncharacterized delta-60 repeat protein